MFAVAVVCAVVASLVNDGMVAWLLAPGFAGGLIYCAARAPLRYSLYVFTFCALTVEKAFEMPVWESPFFPLGVVMFSQLKHTTGIPFFVLSAAQYMLFFLVAIALIRRANGSKIDSRGQVPTPEPLVKLGFVSLAGSGFTWLYGLATGGDFGRSLWQMDKVVYLPIVTWLCHVGLRGPKDHVILGKIVLIAACIRALLAIYIAQTYDPADHGGGEMAHATSHHDSILFAVASVIVLLMLYEKAHKQILRYLPLVLPILVWGMISNERRMVWVQIILVLVTLYFVTPPNKIKRTLKRGTLAMSPLIAAYIAAGWSSQAAIFGPVATLRSVVEPQTDSSSLWREIENYDLLTTFRAAPILGHGYGHPFWEVIPLPHVPFELEFVCPHNSILGLWAFAGFVGFTPLILQWAGAVFFAMRAYPVARVPTDRVAAIVVIGSVIIYMIQCFGDMGLGAWTGLFTLGPGVALAGKLAVATGTWEAKARKPSKKRSGTNAPQTAKAA